MNLSRGPITVAGGISQLGILTVEWILPNHLPWSERGAAPAVLSDTVDI